MQVSFLNQLAANIPGFLKFLNRLATESITLEYSPKITIKMLPLNPGTIPPSPTTIPYKNSFALPIIKNTTSILLVLLNSNGNKKVNSRELTFFDYLLMERKTGFEPATLSLARRYSTTEPLPLMVRMKGLEPPRSYPLEPKSSASANSATSALVIHPRLERGTP